MLEIYDRVKAAFDSNIITPEQVIKATQDLFCIGVLGLRPGRENCNKARQSAKLPEIMVSNPCIKDQLPIECSGCPILDQALRLLVTYLPPKR